MKSQQAIQTTKQQTPASPIFVEAEKLFEQMKEFSQLVGRRAYEFFEARGREFGHDLEDWFRAESELMRGVRWRSRRLRIRSPCARKSPASLQTRSTSVSNHNGWSSAASQRRRRKRRRSRPCSPIPLEPILPRAEAAC